MRVLVPDMKSTRFWGVVLLSGLALDGLLYYFSGLVQALGLFDDFLGLVGLFVLFVSFIVVFSEVIALIGRIHLGVAFSVVTLAMMVSWIFIPVIIMVLVVFVSMSVLSVLVIPRAFSKWAVSLWNKCALRPSSSV